MPRAHNRSPNHSRRAPAAARCAGIDSSVVVPDATELKAFARASGLDAVGIASAELFASTRADLEDRKAAGLHGGMAFTYRNPARSTDPDRALPGARAIVVGALAYPTDPEPKPEGSGPLGRVASYARDDRYGVLRAALDAVAQRLRRDGWRARVLVDDNALVDREAAHRAGLGWYGKSANLLLPGRGSWFVLGSVLTTAPLATDDERVADGCGSCRRCLDACPTGAIVAPGVVDARRCLSWLLQQAGTFPIEHRAALGDRIYGCDDCQEVCPPNRRAPAAPATGAPTWVPLLELLAADDRSLLDEHGRWYIAGRDPRWLRRNALIALGNTAAPGDAEAAAMLDSYRAGADELLAEHAAWAAERIEERAAVAL
jgi:epoxyqueuosine reductase